MSLAIDPLIRLSGIRKIFHTDEVETHALAGIDLDIRAGEYLAVAGPSGCGKTTLLSILGLLDSPSEGSYVLAGEPVAGLSPLQRARVRSRAIGFIFQAFNLIGDLTVFQNVELPLRYRGLQPAARRAEVHEALERVGLLHRINHYPAQLSGGQQQRVAVARAVVGRPVVLLADEPTGNLDSRSGAQVMELLAELHAGGATIVVVTHDPRYLGQVGRTVFLFDGRLVPPGPAHLEVHDGRVLARFPVRDPGSDSESRIHDRGRADTGAGDRGDYGDLQRGERRAVAAAGVSRAGAAGVTPRDRHRPGQD